MANLCKPGQLWKTYDIAMGKHVKPKGRPLENFDSPWKPSGKPGQPWKIKKSGKLWNKNLWENPGKTLIVFGCLWKTLRKPMGQPMGKTLENPNYSNPWKKPMGQPMGKPKDSKPLDQRWHRRASLVPWLSARRSAASRRSNPPTWPRAGRRAVRRGHPSYGATGDASTARGMRMIG